MTLDHRVTRAVHRVADGVEVPRVDLDAIRTQARARRRRTVSIVAAATVVGLITASAAVMNERDATAPLPPSTIPPASTAPTTRAPAPLETDPRTWPTYTSSRYGFTIGHPPGWTLMPARRDWTWQSDAEAFLSSGHEAFLSPAGDVRVSVWAAPLDPDTREESIPYLVSWAEDYCAKSGSTPCTGIADRAVELCLEKWDCHPGLLVPFKDDVQAFFSGGIYDHRSMTVVAVWRNESHPSTAPYGGSQRLLEAFLSTMEVWPSSTPVGERR